MQSVRGICVGDRVFSLVVVELLPKRRALCKCDCGNTSVVWRNNLTRKNTQSCGCLRDRMRKSGEFNRKHGDGGRKSGKAAEYHSYMMMMNRCNNKNADNYAYYGGRGVVVCEAWRGNYPQFLADMGRKPSPQHSLDRVDVNGHYSKENCRWASKQEQAVNRRKKGTAKLSGAASSLDGLPRATGPLQHAPRSGHAGKGAGRV